MSDNQERLIQVALELFSHKGLDVVGIQEVVDQCAVTKPTLYHYFQSKEGLVKAVLNSGFVILNNALNSQKPYKDHLPSYLTEQWNLWFHNVQDQKDFFRFELSLVFLPPDHPAQSLIKPYHSALYSRTLKTFQEATVQYGNMKGRESFLAQSWIGLLHHWTGLFLSENLQTDVFSEKNEILRSYFYGLFS